MLLQPKMLEFSDQSTEATGPILRKTTLPKAISSSFHVDPFTPPHCGEGVWGYDYVFAGVWVSPQFLVFFLKIFL